MSFECDDFEPAHFDDDCIGSYIGNYIGSVEVLVDEFRKIDNTVEVGGIVNTRAVLDDLKDLFDGCGENTSVNTLIGDEQIGYDLTSTARYTAYCDFATDKLISGWYLLRRFNYVGSEFSGHYRFRCEIFFLNS